MHAAVEGIGGVVAPVPRWDRNGDGWLAATFPVLSSCVHVPVAGLNWNRCALVPASTTFGSSARRNRSDPARWADGEPLLRHGRCCGQAGTLDQQRLAADGDVALQLQGGAVGDDRAARSSLGLGDGDGSGAAGPRWCEGQERLREAVQAAVEGDREDAVGRIAGDGHRTARVRRVGSPPMVERLLRAVWMLAASMAELPVCVTAEVVVWPLKVRVNEGRR